MPEARPSRRRTAWHEAGHAVVAWDQKFTVMLVSIRRIGDEFGRSSHCPVVDCTIAEERWRENIVAMGGWAAEHASGETGDTTYDAGDLQVLESRILENLFEIELGWAEQEAARIVLENINRVERLADELLKLEELSDPDQILDIEGKSATR
jgi:ATP-dependent Zn protease